LDKVFYGERGKAEVNYLVSLRWSFGWVYTLNGVPYHHGRVHAAPTPAYTRLRSLV